MFLICEDALRDAICHEHFYYNMNIQQLLQVFNFTLIIYTKWTIQNLTSWDA